MENGDSKEKAAKKNIMKSLFPKVNARKLGENAVHDEHSVSTNLSMSHS